MEKQNMVPTDIVRRRIIVGLLAIPPELFGLAALGGTYSPQQKRNAMPSLMLKRASVDLAKYQREYRTIWQLHVMGNAYHCLQTLRTTIQELELLEREVSGDLQRQVQEYLLGYLLLAAQISRDQRGYRAAYGYANKAVKVAESRNIVSMLAPALCERGFTSLVWGQFGEVDYTGAFKPDPHKIAQSVPDLEETIQYAHPQLKGIAALSLGRARGIVKRSGTDITLALRQAEQAEQWLGHDDFDSLYVQQMVLARSVLNRGRILLGQAVIFNAVGSPGNVDETIETLRNLKGDNGISNSHTRRNAWVDIVRAEAHMGLKKFDQAACYAMDALKVCWDIQSKTNIVIIGDIYSRLLASSFSNHPEMKDLGAMLRTCHPLWKNEETRL
jgi:hypothetical protein